jgi:hypothetical protein
LFIVYRCTLGSGGRVYYFDDDRDFPAEHPT